MLPPRTFAGLLALLLAVPSFLTETARAEVIIGASIDFEEADFLTPTASRPWTTGPAGDPTYIWFSVNMYFNFDREFITFDEMSNGDSFITLKVTVPAGRFITDVKFSFDAIRLYGDYGSGGDDQVAVQYSLDDFDYTTMKVYNNTGGGAFTESPGVATATLPSPSSELYLRFAKLENTIENDPGRYDINSNFNIGGLSANSYVQVTTVVPEPSTVPMGVLGLAGLVIARRFVARRV